MRHTLSALAAALTLAAVPALAGIADSPLPVLVVGASTQHLYSVPFFQGGGSTETIFACTSTDTVPVQACVEVFSLAGGAPGNDCSSTSLSVPAGGTVKFGTGATTWIAVGSIVGGSPAGGLARILATSKKLVCTAFLVDSSSFPPISMMHLTIIAKTKQKAAN